MAAKTVRVPLDVPAERRKTWEENYRLMTRDKGRLFLMAGDQKVEHLNDDFFGQGIDPEDASPEHLFRIASSAPVGCFATQLGLIARYGESYPDIPYLVKLNSKSHLVKTAQRDPVSLQWQTMEQVGAFIRSSGLKITGVGYTIYPGSEHESEMLTEAARLINDAHRMGLVAVIWSYPRGKAVNREQDPHLVAGAAGVAACLGADFVKVNAPLSPEGNTDGHLLSEAVKAAGRTGVVCAGGHETTPEAFLGRLHDQIHEGETVGCATGRNVHQRSLEEAVRLCKAIHAVAIDNEPPREAMRFFRHP
ncbi:MAG: beta/alpha barrel domain-containing protein [Leptospirillum sp.]